MFDMKHFYEEPATIALATIAVVSGGAAYEQNRQASKDSESAREVQQRIQDVKTARERRKAVRQARTARAEIEARAQASGTASTSSAVSGAGTVGTQLASNLSFLDEVKKETQTASMFEGRSSSKKGCWIQCSIELVYDRSQYLC